MRPVTTDGVAWSVCWSVGLSDTISWAVQKWLNWSRCHLGCGCGWAQGDIRWVSRSPHTEALLRGKCSRYTQSYAPRGSTGTLQMPFGCTRLGAYWRHLANTIEPSMCGSDVALYTLTTCYSCSAMLARYMLWHWVCLSICLSQVGVLSRW